MADSKITALGANTAPLSTDVTVIVDDPGGTPATQKITLADLALGIGGAWANWTPTLTNLSGGTQTYAKYIQIGKTVHFRFKYTLAGAGVSGSVGFTIPVAKASGYGDSDASTMHHSAILRDEGAGDYIGFCAWGSSTRLDVYALATDVTNLSYRSVTSTVPFTWANTDSISVHGTYEAA